MAEPAPNVLSELMKVINDRKKSPSDDSYTSRLLVAGVEKINSKITEEATEVVEAALEIGEQGKKHLIHEVADLLYHAMVLLAARDSQIQDVESELARRFGVSGIEEKASRRNTENPK